MDRVGQNPRIEYKDRRTGLTVFGVLLIILGLLTSLAIPLMMFGALVSGTMPGTEPIPVRMILPSVLMYAGLAVAFIWLGIGSLKCRRWARALLLILSWIWLVAGTEGLIVTGLIMPQILAHPRPGMAQVSAPVQMIIMIFSLGLNSIIFVLIPLGLLLFYRSAHVKATCEARSPALSWTDRCPLPILALSLVLGVGALSFPIMILTSNSIVPCFGMYLSGLPASILLLVVSGIYGFSAWSCFNQRIVGWWTALVFNSIWMLSYDITIARIGLLPMYELMQMPKSQIEQMKAIGIFENQWIWLIMLVCSLPYLGLILYTKRCFDSKL